MLVRRALRKLRTKRNTRLKKQKMKTNHLVKVVVLQLCQVKRGKLKKTLKYCCSLRDLLCYVNSNNTLILHLLHRFSYLLEYLLSIQSAFDASNHYIETV